MGPLGDRRLTHSRIGDALKMNTRIILLALALLLPSAGLRAEENPFVGTWKINSAKSDKNGELNAILTYQVLPDGRLRFINSFDAPDGAPHGWLFTAKYGDAEKVRQTSTRCQDKCPQQVLLRRIDSNTQEEKRFYPD